MLMRTHERRESSDWLVTVTIQRRLLVWKKKWKPRASSTTESVEAQRMAIFTWMWSSWSGVSDKCVCVGCDRRRHSKKKTGFWKARSFRTGQKLYMRERERRTRTLSRKPTKQRQFSFAFLFSNKRNNNKNKMPWAFQRCHTHTVAYTRHTDTRHLNWIFFCVCEIKRENNKIIVLFDMATRWLFQPPFSWQVHGRRGKTRADAPPFHWGRGCTSSVNCLITHGFLKKHGLYRTKKKEHCPVRARIFF